MPHPKKKIVCVCACVRLILVLVWKKLCVCSTNLGFSVGYVLCTRYVCTTLYDTRYVDTRYALCTRYVCTTLAVVLLIVQLYRMIPTFRPRNSCIAICIFVSGWLSLQRATADRCNCRHSCASTGGT